ncbi:MAG: haloacid dehalogenase type II [Tabrizicola sp.]|uniref:haloacid dehalogenase type II n=1 Tax=Tabrizicola sp. TaxID=2005166 RepID=UPI0027364BD6|nr:haloacid dehalogenase type II [Tabrizicola sp.]MDP3263056.1 haloacid dehalogenase type II [Tabrizicola sp.]MDP3648591.1 haloacid dehalogenase type II [Paracoccaceae bacterium]MDZ4068871.1 haloacid dehalogenase type II [Tabrizicola sp.]
MPSRKIVVFDAYGTVFDVAGAVRQASAEAGPLVADWAALAATWRRKQLEYSWLRTLLGAHADFAEVTAEALDWTFEALGLNDRALRGRLLALYDRLPSFPEVAQALDTLKHRGFSLALLSNGTPAMLKSALAANALQDRFDAVISVEEAGVYKPSPQVYALVEQRMAVTRDKVLFVSSNGWDVAGAARFGFATVWVNRDASPMDRLPHGPNHIIPDLARLSVIA